MRQSNKVRFSRRHSNSKIINDLNVTPLVDVMLVLLIIFMVTSPMLIAGVQVDLPKTTASPITTEDQPITLTIDTNGKVYIGEHEHVKREQLIQKLKNITAAKMDSRVFIRGDARVNYGKIMEIIGEINAAGFTKVALITEQK